MTDRFQSFIASFVSDSPGMPTVAMMPSLELIDEVPGFRDLIAGCAGRVLKLGAYRLFDKTLFAATAEFVELAFPAWQGRLAPFGCDWMGRIFAVDGSGRTGSGGERCVILLDPATRDLLQVPATVTEFHNEILVDEGELAYEESLWASWLSEHATRLDYSDVVGWRAPAFLGGELALANLEIQPALVYWSLSAQLIAQTFKLSPGERVERVDIE
jgi:hypothetical protein